LCDGGLAVLDQVGLGEVRGTVPKAYKCIRRCTTLDFIHCSLVPASNEIDAIT
jgi:hypothetical protein